jgi:hypothetical protein
MSTACRTYERQERCLQGLVRKPEEKRPHGRPRSKWEDVIKMDLYDVGWGGMDWINLAQGGERRRALVNAVMTFWLP